MSYGEEILGDNSNFGSFQNWLDRTLDLWCSFVSYHQSYLLNFWHMLEKFDLIASSMQRLSMKVSARDGLDGVPVVVNATSPVDISWSAGVDSLALSTKK